MLVSVFMFLVSAVLAWAAYLHDWAWYNVYCNAIVVITLIVMMVYIVIALVHTDTKTLECPVTDAKRVINYIIYGVSDVSVCLLPALLLGFPRLPEGLMGVLR